MAFNAERPAVNLLKKRVAFITSGLPTGGAELVLLSLLSRLDRNRFEPFVISLRGEGDLGQSIRDLSIPVLALKLGLRPRLAFEILRGIRTLRRFDPDVIQGWMYHGNVFSWLAAPLMRRRPRLLFSIHNALSDWTSERHLTRKIIRLNGTLSGSADRVIYPSEPSALQHEALGYAQDRTQIIPNGFDCDRFAPDTADRARIRSELGFADDDFVIGMAARYHPVKDHAILLAAVRDTLDRCPSTRLLLCGPGVDDKNSELQNLIRKHGLEQVVRLLGTRRDMPRIYRAMDLLALSSKSESAPGVLAEAMASGVPCVATDVGVCKKTLAGTGWVVTPRDRHSIAEGLIAAAELPREALKLRGERARTEIVSTLALSAMIEAYQSLFDAATTPS